MTNAPVRRSEPDPIGVSSTGTITAAGHFAWRIPGIFKADPAKIAAELDSLGWRVRPLTPDEIVAFARDPETELHKCFPWDDAEAAESWRRDVARRVTTSIRIVVTGPTGTTIERLAIHVEAHGKERGGYMPIRMVARDEARSYEAMARAIRDLRAWLDRHKELEQRLPVAFGTVRGLVEEIAGMAGAEAAE